MTVPAVTRADESDSTAPKRPRVSFCISPSPGNTITAKAHGSMIANQRSASTKLAAAAAAAAFTEAEETEGEHNPCMSLLAAPPPFAGNVRNARSSCDATPIGTAARAGTTSQHSVPETSSECFEQFRGSLRARHGPLFTQYTALLMAERGMSGGAEHDVESLGLGRVAAVMEAMVQLADLRCQQQRVSRASELQRELELAACELFEALCCEVGALPNGLPAPGAVPTDTRHAGPRRRWDGARDDVDIEHERTAVRAAALFRMKDTVASLYAWSLLTRSAAFDVVRALQDEATPRNAAMVLMDPIAGTGLHAIIFQAAGIDYASSADAVSGGSTQSSGADTQYFDQCSSSTSSPAYTHGIAEGRFSGHGAQRLSWVSAERLDVFNSGDEAEAWWACQSVRRKAQATGDKRPLLPVLLLSFPPPPPSAVAEVALKRFHGEWLIFLGEWRGCTGTASFFDALDSDWEVRGKLGVPQWPMMEDQCFLLRRRGLQQTVVPVGDHAREA